MKLRDCIRPNDLSHPSYALFAWVAGIYRTDPFLPILDQPGPIWTKYEPGPFRVDDMLAAGLSMLWNAAQSP